MIIKDVDDAVTVPVAAVIAHLVNIVLIKINK